MNLELFREYSDEPDFEGVTLPEIARMVWRLNRDVNGNGKPGIKTLVTRHDTYFKIMAGVLLASIPAGALFISIGQAAGWFPR